MKLLIVDDNKYVVEGVKRQLNWKLLGIEEVFGCYSVPQAKEILQEEEIDFLISDIEMPGQGGFELLDWIREQKMDPETVLLTSYADFSYAQAAVSYQCSHYLLKPVSTEVLENIFCELVAKRMERQKEKQMMEYGNNWLSHQSVVKELFWRDVLDESMPENEEHLLRRIQKENLSYSLEDQFVIVLICFELGKDKKGWSTDLLGFSCENVLNEITQERDALLEGFCYNGYFQFAVVFKLKEGGTQEQVKEILQQFTKIFIPFYRDGINCYIGETCGIRKLYRHLRRLEEIHLDSLNREDEILLEQEYEDKLEESYQAPEAEEWKTLLLTGRTELLEKQVLAYFEDLREKKAINHKLLMAVLADWNLLAYSVLREHNLTTYQFVTHFRDQELAELSVRSVKCMQQLILTEAAQIAEQIQYIQKTDVIIEDIQEYIRTHLDTATRSQIAEAFYLSPNYLSKLFRKETGASLSEYIQSERMSLAKQLLLQDQLSISQIAAETGYPSFAHFSKQFKKFVGMTPNEYRKKQ